LPFPKERLVQGVQLARIDDLHWKSPRGIASPLASLVLRDAQF